MLGLAPSLHLADFGDRVVLLDTRADRYRLVTGRRAAALQAIACGRTSTDDQALGALVADGTLTTNAMARPRHDLPVPARGALEVPPGEDVALPTRTIARIAIETVLRLRLGRLDRAIAWSRSPTPAATPPGDAVLLGYAQAFDTRRMLVPLGRSCLRDALAMSRMLSLRAIPCRLVFGVRIDPFAAHCWVQTGDLVLTGSLAAARELVPILVR